MKKPNIRARRNGGIKAASPQVPNKPETASAEPGIHSNQTAAPWLKIEQLVILKVLGSNHTKFGLALKAIATLSKELGVSLDGEDDSVLHLFTVLGWANEEGCNYWRITEAGRAVLQHATKSDLPESVGNMAHSRAYQLN